MIQQCVIGFKLWASLGWFLRSLSGTRQTIQILLSGIKGDVVAYQPYAMGRMKSLWGDDAEEFRPERWLDIDGKFQQESPFKFIAFQAGPRVCLGKDFSYRQMKIFSAILLGSYKFKLVDEHKSIHYRTSLTLHLDGGPVGDDMFHWQATMA